MIHGIGFYQLTRIFFKYKIKISNKFDYYGHDQESIVHTFHECEIATGMWQEVVTWYNSSWLNIGNLTDIQILFATLTLIQFSIGYY